MISTGQLFCILLLSRLSAEVVFTDSVSFSGSSLAALAAAELINFLLALPVIVYSARGSSVYGRLAEKNRAFGAVSGYISAFVICWLASRTLLYAAEYAQHSLVSGMSGAVLCVLLGGFAVYSAVKGIEAVCRASLLFAAAAVVVSAAVVLADIPHLQLRRISAAQPDSEFLHHVLHRVLRGGEYLIFAALLPYVRGRKKSSSCKTVLLFAASSLAGTLLMSVFSMSVLGEVCNIAKYPFTAAAGLADITLFKRLDGFAAAVWAASAGLRSAVMFFSAYAMIKSVLKPSEDRARIKGETA